MVFALLTGVLAGIVHVFSGPDHVAAVMPFTAARRRKPWKTGVLWGLGHTSGVWSLALLVLLFKDLIDVDLVSRRSDVLVGLVLVGVGIWGLRRAMTCRIHYHEHSHDGVRHAHFHLHGKGGRRAPHEHSHAPLAVGMLHGLGGGAHLFAALPALALPGTSASVSYVVGYGAGSIAAMGGFSWMLGTLVRRWVGMYTGAYRFVTAAFALAAIGVGVAWIRMT